jgi:hypothetical protein
MDLADVTMLVGFAGGLAVLVSFAGVVWGRLSAHGATYHAMNLTGGLALVAAGVSAEAWPSVAVNGSWALISAHGLVRAVRPPRTDEHPAPRAVSRPARAGSRRGWQLRRGRRVWLAPRARRRASSVSP